MQQKNLEHRRTESEFVRSVSNSPLSNVCKYVFQPVQVWLVTVDSMHDYLYFLCMTGVEINFDLILLYFNLLGLHVIENISPSQKLTAIDM